MIFFLIIFFGVIEGSLILSIKDVLFHKKSINEQYRALKKQYNHFLYFVHEFHHIIGSQILHKNYKNISNTYMLVCDTLHYKPYPVFAEVRNISFISYDYDVTDYVMYSNNLYLALTRLKMVLSGYAAEEAFKLSSFLLNYFAQYHHQHVNTKSFFTLMLDNYYNKNFISDINKALSLQKAINFKDQLILPYLISYKKKSEKNAVLLAMEYNIKKLYPNIKNEFLQLLFILYEELISQYKSIDHQKKFYVLLEKNPELFAHEIFFFKDIQSIWKSQSLNRDMTNMDTFTSKEKEIINKLINNTIYPLQKIKELKMEYAETKAIATVAKKISILYTFIINKKKNLYSFFQAYKQSI